MQQHGPDFNILSKLKDTEEEKTFLKTKPWKDKWAVLNLLRHVSKAQNHLILESSLLEAWWQWEHLHSR